LHLNLHFIVTHRAPFNVDIDITVFGEFDGVAHQVGDHLLQAQRVANDVIRHIIFDV
jgi:hypothetical protein